MDLQSWVAAAATVVLAGFAGVQVWREIRAGNQRQRAATSQISGTAFLLRRQLRSWLGIEPSREQGISAWRDMAQRYGSSKAEQDNAESRMEELARLAPEVGGRVSERILAAYVLFLDATNRLNEYESTAEPPGGEVFDWLQLMGDATTGLTECLAALEDGPISKDLLDTHRELQERRERDAPFNQFADALLEEMTPEQIGGEGAETLPPGENEPPE